MGLFSFDEKSLLKAVRYGFSRELDESQFSTQSMGYGVVEVGLKGIRVSIILEKGITYARVAPESVWTANTSAGRVELWHDLEAVLLTSGVDLDPRRYRWMPAKRQNVEFLCGVVLRHFEVLRRAMSEDQYPYTVVRLGGDLTMLDEPSRRDWGS